MKFDDYGERAHGIWIILLWNYLMIDIVSLIQNVMAISDESVQKLKLAHPMCGKSPHLIFMRRVLVIF